MATLFQFPPHFVSLSSRKSRTSIAFTFFYHHSCFHSNRRDCNGRYSIVCLASTKRARPSRKLLGDDELCNVLREFVASVGLPEGHIPSTKELSHHGRKDLANIVRRRGHKLIKELLSNSAETTTDGFDSLKSLNNDSKEKSDSEETGQKGKLHDTCEEPIDIPLMDDNSDTGTNLVVKHESAVIANGESHVSKDPPLTLQEKVENFMKYGHLDTVEDDVCGDLILNDDSTILNNHGRSEGETMIHSEDDAGHLARVNKNYVGQNGTLLLTRSITPPETEDKCASARDMNSSTRRPQTADIDDNLHVEAGQMENEVEINRLKQMLHQKELELSRLKEEIEKEKYALSILQTKAENEITKAQKLILEKDAELLAAEESLSGLMEAKIEYSGEGQMVEVAGSFNGWHQKIKMDPLPSTSILEPVESRKSRLWSTTLWLYPGVYEMKFIVDGQWKIDPQKESTNKGGVENNILRVDR